MDKRLLCHLAVIAVVFCNGPFAHGQGVRDIDRDTQKKTDVEVPRLEDREHELLKALDELKRANGELQKSIDELSKKQVEVNQAVRSVQHELNTIRLQLLQ